MACPASGNLDKAIPNWEEPVREEKMGAKSKGHFIHELIADLITFSYETETKVYKNNWRDLVAVAEILQAVAEIWQRRRFQVLSETSMKAEWLDDPTDTTADLVFYTQDEMHIIDFKMGKILVDLDDNDQMMFYAATYGILAPKAKEVNLYIMQPFAPDGFQHIVVTTAELQAWMQKARASQKLVLAGDTTFGPSDHCTFCPANPHSRGDRGKPLCPAMMQVLYPQPPALDEDEILNL